MDGKLKVCCKNCKHSMALSRKDCKIYSDEQNKYDEWIDRYTKMKDFEEEDKSELGCNYKCRYIEYPLKVLNGICVEKIEYNKEKDVSKLVRITYCKDKKTYLGLYLGELATAISVSHNELDSNLNVRPAMCNPAILVPILGKIIFGYESFWQFIKSEEDFKDITQDEIDNIWYIKLLKKIGERD